MSRRLVHGRPNCISRRGRCFPIRLHPLYTDGTRPGLLGTDADLSDIDLVVSNKVVTEATKARLLAELARAMRQAYITDTVAIISKARVPIIKFVTLEGAYS